MDNIWVLPLLFLVGLVAGLVDAIAGGGGLITVPALLGVGLSPQQALGTNKLQSSFGSGSAMLHFAGAGDISLKKCAEGIACTALGAGLGALAVQRLDPAFLRGVIPWLLAAIAIYTLCSPRLGYEETTPRFRQGPFYLLAGLTLGFYDGFFGPGTGSFWVMALMLGLGLSMRKATGYTKVMNFTSNAVSLALFAWGGCVHYREGLVMGAGQFLGARIGARLVIRKGAALVRPIFVTMVLAITARLIYLNFR